MNFDIWSHYYEQVQLHFKSTKFLFLIMVELDHLSNLQKQFSCNFSNKYLAAIKKINE